MENFVQRLTALMEEFYKDPKNAQAYQEWLKTYEHRTIPKR